MIIRHRKDGKVKKERKEGKDRKGVNMCVVTYGFPRFPIFFTLEQSNGLSLTRFDCESRGDSKTELQSKKSSVTADFPLCKSI